MKAFIVHKKCGIYFSIFTFNLKLYLNSNVCVCVSGTSLWWSTTWVCWTTCLTSSAVCTESPARTGLSPCPSASEKVRFVSELFALYSNGGAQKRWPLYTTHPPPPVLPPSQVSTSSWTVTFPQRISGFVRPHWSSRWLRRPMRRKWSDSGTTMSVGVMTSFPVRPVFVRFLDFDLLLLFFFFV